MCCPETRTTGRNCARRFSACGYLTPDSDFIEYAIDDYPVRLIALDTLSSGSNKGDFCPERVRHLIDMIEAETTKPIAVFTHHPPFEVTVGPESLHFETRKQCQDCAELCNIPGGWSLSSAAMFTVPQRVMSRASRRP